MYIKKIDNDKPVINISGDCDNAQLFFNGKKLSSITSLERGTIEYLINNLHHSHLESTTLLKKYRDFLLNFNNKEITLPDFFNTFSNFLGSGNYIIKNQRADKRYSLYEYFRFDLSFYGGNQSFIALQKMDDLNRGKIEKYKTEIKSGKLPPVIVLGFEDSRYYYILDGHHKIKAYEELNITPNIIFFEKIYDNSKKITHYSNNTYIYKDGNAATLVECSLELNFDYKHKDFGTSSKRKIKLHPTEWSSGVVINKKESEIIQQEVDDFFLENNIFADIKKRLKERSALFRLKKYINRFFKI